MRWGGTMRHLDEGALQGWLDRDRAGLSALERDEIALHLAGCAACRSRLEEVEALAVRADELLGGANMEDEAVPPYAQVVARARRGRASAGKRSPWVAGGWAASLVAALGVGWMANAALRRHGGPDVRVEESQGAAAQENELPAPPEATSRPSREGASPGRPIVSGQVTDQDGRPLAGAQVYLEGTRSGSLTDVEGRFQIKLGASGADTTGRDLTLTALMIGYETEHHSIRLDRGDVVADFRLPQAAVSLDEIVVTGVAGGDVTAGPPEIVLAPGGDERTWAEVTRAEAETRAAFRLLTVPDLRVLRIQIEDGTGIVLVRVVQELADGGVLDLVEAQAPLGFDRTTAEDGRARETVRRGGVTVAAAAPIEEDALRALLSRLR